MIEWKHGPLVRGFDLCAECVLVLLAGALDERDERDETEEEEELVLVAPDGVHSVQGEGSRETLIAHIEGA